MKTSLSHLPENKQYEIRRIVDTILEVVKPEKIILFGSYAKGTYVEDRYQTKDGTINEYISDYDFLVVTKDNSDKTSTQESMILDRVDRYEPPVNLEIHEIDYINEGLGWGQYFFMDIVSEGILLHDTKAVEFVKPRVLTPAEEKQKALDYFELWFPRSIEFTKGAKFYLSENAIKVGVFNLHQATESLYYSILLVFTGYKPKTHNLWKLRKKTKAYSEELFSVFRAETDKKEENLFDLLKRGYIDARYRADYIITKDELAVLIDRIENMIPIVKDICSEKIASFH
jgi:HEPN domain-containing protein/predicted nucleotidyltransferase